MLNTFVLAGIVTEKAEKVEGRCEFTVRCDRSFREETGDRMQDDFRVRVWKGLADEMNNLIKEGLLVGVKGRMRNENGEIVLIAEQVSFDHRRKPE